MILRHIWRDQALSLSMKWLNNYWHVLTVLTPACQGDWLQLIVWQYDGLQQRVLLGTDSIQQRDPIPRSDKGFQTLEVLKAIQPEQEEFHEIPILIQHPCECTRTTRMQQHELTISGMSWHVVALHLATLLSLKSSTAREDKFCKCVSLRSLFLASPSQQRLWFISSQPLCTNSTPIPSSTEYMHMLETKEQTHSGKEPSDAMWLPFSSNFFKFLKGSRLSKDVSPLSCSNSSWVAPKQSLQRNIAFKWPQCYSLPACSTHWHPALPTI